MLINDGLIKIGILIIDDEAEQRITTENQLMGILTEKGLKDKYICFIHNLEGWDPSEDWSFNDYMEIANQSDKIEKVDFMVIDANLSQGEDTIDGLDFAYKFQDDLRFLKTIYTGKTQPKILERLVMKVPSLYKNGNMFFFPPNGDPVLIRGKSFSGKKKENKILEPLAERILEVYTKKRSKAISDIFSEKSILELIQEKNLNNNACLEFSTLSDGQNNNLDPTLTSLFPECNSSEDLKKQLITCITEKSRFALIESLWIRDNSNRYDAIRLLTHPKDDNARGALSLMLQEGSFIDGRLNPSRRRYTEQVKPWLTSQEYELIDSFFDKIEKLIKMGDANIEDLYSLGMTFRANMRLHLNKMVKKLMDDLTRQIRIEIDMDIELYCPVTMILRQLKDYVLMPLNGDGDLVISSQMTIDIARTILIISGKLAKEDNREYNEGAFSLNHGEKLSDCFVNGNFFKHIKDSLLPLYFSPMLVESYGGDKEWHCTNLTSLAENKSPVDIDEETFEAITGVQTLKGGTFTGVRYLLRIQEGLT